VTSRPADSTTPSASAGSGAAATPFADLLAENRAYAESFRLNGLEPRAARGLGLLTCMDSRIEPLGMLGLVPGDAKILRNAGARVTPDVIRTLILAVHLLGVERILVVPHTRCGTLGEQDAIKDAIRGNGGPGNVDLDLLTTTDQTETLRGDLELLRSSPYLAGVDVAGAVYDVDTGLLSDLVV
jgi:carbonic anhydrase